ncbi:MAG: putative lipid II flippase FtsW [Gammaproteobacteria bacterium]|nr:MAG: putative lipid II flippase FtsW [Gammaproteobacteria bacterium]
MKIIIDKKLFYISAAIILFGLVMVFSASASFAKNSNLSAHYFAQKQTFIVLIGLLLAYIVTQIPVKFWQETRVLFLFFALLLLVAVFIPGIGKTINGSTRWIYLGGMGLQVSELAKLLVFIYFAGYLTYHEKKVANSFLGFIKPFILIGFVCVLILLAKDLGTTIVVMVTAMGMAFMARAKFHYFLTLFIVNGVGIYLLTVTSAYRKARLMSFVDPWQDTYGAGYQLTQSLIAIGSGKWFGAGLGNGVQKLLYLPEAYNDFIFAVFSEEFGFIGIVLLVGIFSMLIYRMMQISLEAQSCNLKFNAYLGYGISFWFALQVIIHMGVNLGILPTTGLTLPLVSYGGSSILVMVTALAFMFRISYETKKYSVTDAKAKEKNKDKKIIDSNHKIDRIFMDYNKNTASVLKNEYK